MILTTKKNNGIVWVLSNYDSRHSPNETEWKLRAVAGRHSPGTSKAAHTHTHIERGPATERKRGRGARKITGECGRGEGIIWFHRWGINSAGGTATHRSHNARALIMPLIRNKRSKREGKNTRRPSFRRL